MKIRELLLDERINDNTTVIIKEATGRPITCGYWYQDGILAWGCFHAIFEWVKDKNVAIFELI